jgi:hypothetical protein
LFRRLVLVLLLLLSQFLSLLLLVVVVVVLVLLVMAVFLRLRLLLSFTCWVSPRTASIFGLQPDDDVTIATLRLSLAAQSSDGGRGPYLALFRGEAAAPESTGEEAPAPHVHVQQHRRLSARGRLPDAGVCAGEKDAMGTGDIGLVPVPACDRAGAGDVCDGKEDKADDICSFAGELRRA